jgi:FAD synthetase
METVLCFGTFDGLHLGHEDYFRQARALGDRLVVIVARDETVVDVKGRSPRQGEEVRLGAVRRHSLVSEARLGLPGDKYQIVEEINPDLILLGYDQQAFTDDLEDALRARGLSCKVMRAAPFKPEVYKSSLLNV